jgi:hypothetical protein
MKRKGKALTFFLCLGVLAGGAVAEELVAEDPLDFVTDQACNTATILISWIAPMTCYGDSIENLEYTEDNTDSLMTSIHGNGVTISDTRNQTTQNQMAHLNQSYGIGMAQSKSIAIEDLTNGSSLSSAQDDSLQHLNDFYAAIESQTYKYRNREIIAFNNSLEKARDDSGIKVWDTYTCGHSTLDGTDGIFRIGNSALNDLYKVYDVHLWETTVELTNGSEQLAYGINGTITQSTDNSCDTKTAESDAVTNVSGTIVDPQIKGGAITGKELIDVYDDTYSDPVQFLDDSDWSEVKTRFDSNYDRALDNTQATIEDIYNSYTAGELNETDIELGPLETLVSASTNYEDTGYYSYRTISLAQMGLATNESYAFNVSWDGEKTALGQLFVPESFNDTLVAGETYDAEGHRVEIVYQPDSGSAKREVIDDNFTINTMKDAETGEKINKTRVQSVKFYTGNVSDLPGQYDRVADYRDEVTGSSGIAGGITLGEFWENFTLGGLFTWLSGIRADQAVLLLLTAVIALGAVFK